MNESRTRLCISGLWGKESVTNEMNDFRMSLEVNSNISGLQMKESVTNATNDSQRSLELDSKIAGL